MYVRQFGYAIVPGQEEKAAALCVRLVDVLRAHGVAARVLVGGGRGTTLQLEEEYASLNAMHGARAALEDNEPYRAALCTWAAEFYPLVQAAAPAVVLAQPAAA